MQPQEKLKKHEFELIEDMLTEFYKSITKETKWILTNKRHVNEIFQKGLSNPYVWTSNSTEKTVFLFYETKAITF